MARILSLTHPLMLAAGCGAPPGKPEVAADPDALITGAGKPLFRELGGGCHRMPDRTAFTLSVAAGQGRAYFDAYLCCQDSLLLHQDPLALALQRAWNTRDAVHHFRLSPAERDALWYFLYGNKTIQQ